MKKRAKSKTKKSKGSKDAGAMQTELPDLVGAMMKIAERLETLEKKVDLVINRPPVRILETQHRPENVQLPEPPRQSLSPQQPGQPSQQNQGQKERVLYRAVCADCSDDCEVPFKPREGRPIYCQDCFKERKGGRSSKPSIERIHIPNHIRQMPSRHSPGPSFSHEVGKTAQTIGAGRRAVRGWDGNRTRSRRGRDFHSPRHGGHGSSKGAGHKRGRNRKRNR